MAAPAVRRADFLMALAYATDLLPVSRGISRCAAACSRCGSPTRPASTSSERRNVYHQALLRYVGCNADTHLLAAAFGDEIALRQDLARIDIGDTTELVETFVRALNRVFAGRCRPPSLPGRSSAGLADALQVSVPILAGHCEVAKRIGAAPRPVRTRSARISASSTSAGTGTACRTASRATRCGLAVRMVTLAQDAVVLAEAHGREAMRR